MVQTETWSALAQKHGRNSAVSLTITEAELDALTAHQSALLIDALRPLLAGDEERALDFGCGSARLTHMLHDLLLHPQPVVWGYDPCREMLALAKEVPEKPLILTTRPPYHIRAFDVVLMAMVLGDPECDVGATIAQAVNFLTPRGLFILLEHMPSTPPFGRWWRFRSQHFYQGIFKNHDVILDHILKIPQLDNAVTVLAGRRRNGHKRE